MKTYSELSCFDCPVVGEIARQLERTEIVRRETIDKSVRAMGSFAQIEDAGEYKDALKKRWQNISGEIFSLLDSAETLLKTNRVGLTETCDTARPFYETTQKEGEQPALKCSSLLAKRVMRELGLKDE